MKEKIFEMWIVLGPLLPTSFLVYWVFTAADSTIALVLMILLIGHTGWYIGMMVFFFTLKNIERRHKLGIL